MRTANWRWIARGLATAGLMAMVTAALGHGRAETTPADGASLTEPPETIAVAFEAPTRVTSLKVTGPDGAVALASPPTKEATERIEVKPAEALVPGEHTVQWRALGSDGHAFKGSMAFTVTD
jgi:methionine-rich copper-binding protein CopC